MAWGRAGADSVVLVGVRSRAANGFLAEQGSAYPIVHAEDVLRGALC
jgi:hypothetical protein